ncbi:hypothetical protein VUR80DRAFT_8990 [Thermomyces stellatus]
MKPGTMSMRDSFKSSKKRLQRLFGRAASPAPSATQLEVRSERKDGKHSSETSPVIAAESCAPPGCSTADANLTPPNTDVTDNPELAATEPTAQQTAALPASQRLWNAAYDALERDDADLIRSDISADLHDPAKRQLHMKKLVEEGQAKISRASKITNRLGEVADAVLSIKGIIDVAVQSVPQAALP